MNQYSILCYGDSNTWGYIPTHNYQRPAQRYNRKHRWPGILQYLLGDNYYVIEEGLNGRTINVEDAAPPNRNGKTYLPPCLYTHAPIDLVILALGSNDLKLNFNRSPQEIKQGLMELITIIHNSKCGPDLSSAPQILITPPVIPLNMVENDDNSPFNGAIHKAEALTTLFRELANEHKCHYLNLNEIATPSEVDGIHFDAVAHNKIAIAAYQKIISIFF